jgi:acid phosphatase type 7
MSSIATRFALLSALATLLPGSPAAIAAGLEATVAAAGDIACAPEDARYNGGQGTANACRMADTAALLAGLAAGEGLDAVLLLGDNQYEDGALQRYQTSYHPTWGRFLGITRPAAGNHEYATPGAAGYFSYFGAAAGEPGRGWYSFDLAGWHVVVLNSNCSVVGGCGSGSPQLRWLEADLAAHAGACILATWHHPRFSSGLHGDDPQTAPFWEALYRTGADLILTGHDHDYERFAPQDPSGRADPLRGIRQFVVGTGGKDLRPFPLVRPNSEARDSVTFGVLKLKLRPGSYDWEFLPAAGGTFTDSGTAACHSAAGDTLPLLGGRFRAQVAWRDFAGTTGTGRRVPTAAGDSGVFWFFHPDNWELLVKMVDGCAANGRFWVFGAGVTNVEYELTVTDTATGRSARYANPLGQVASAVADTRAFECP